MSKEQTSNGSNRTDEDAGVAEVDLGKEPADASTKRNQGAHLQEVGKKKSGGGGGSAGFTFTFLEKNHDLK